MNASTSNALRQSFQAFWSARAPREQTSLKLMAVVLALGALWAVYAWTISERQRLDRALPQTRAQVRSMQDAAAALVSLRGQTRVAQAELSTIEAALRAAAQASGLALTIDNDGQGLLVRGERLNFDAWLNWLASAQRSHGMRPSELTVSSDATGVRIEARLAPAARGG